MPRLRTSPGPLRAAGGKLVAAAETARTIALLVEYDGSTFAGWQVQPNGVAVQEVLESALARVAGHPVRVRSSGRTDAGVHARGMVAAFTTSAAIPCRAFSDGANSYLPPEVAVLAAVDAPPGFDPRIDATGKHYRYTILNRHCRSPLARGRSWHVRAPLDLVSMREAAAHLVGTNDFALFRTTGCAARTTVRTITRLDIHRDGAFIHLDVFGTGFLRNMVRIIAGTLVEAGLGRRAPDSIPSLLQGEGQAGATAPPQGLCLMEVFYPFRIFP